MLATAVKVIRNYEYSINASCGQSDAGSTYPGSSVVDISSAPVNNTLVRRSRYIRGCLTTLPESHNAVYKYKHSIRRGLIYGRVEV